MFGITLHCNLNQCRLFANVTYCVYVFINDELTKIFLRKILSSPPMLVAIASPKYPGKLT
jgi:hypothetical protein